MQLFQETIAKVKGLNKAAMKEAKERIDNLIKPQRSLGKLEEIAIQLSGITGQLHPQVDNKAVIVMAADNGVCEEGISAAPQAVTKMMTNYIANDVSGVCAISAQARADVIVVDIGVIGEINNKNIINKKIKHGTDNFTKGPAMTKEEAVKAIEAGIEVTIKEISKGRNLLGTGEMGIGNTTSSTAILSVIGKVSPEKITGIGANLPQEKLTHKINIIKKAIEINKPVPNDGVDVLSKIGGLDIAGMVGVMIAGAASKVPVVVDGYISTAAAIIAVTIEPKIKGYLICSHASNEKGACIASSLLGFKPILNLDMRLGEGTGAALAFNIIEAAVFMSKKMITFQEAGIGIV